NERHGRIYQWSERVFESVAAFYARTLERVLGHPVETLLVTVATLVLSIVLYVAAPKGFFPTVDSGFIIGTAQAAPDISYEAMASRMQALGRIVMADPDVGTVDYWIGTNPTMSQARMFINLKPRAERRSAATEVIQRLKRRTAAVEGISLFMQVRQDITVGG